MRNGLKCVVCKKEIADDDDIFSETNKERGRGRVRTRERGSVCVPNRVGKDHRCACVCAHLQECVCLSVYMCCQAVCLGIQTKSIEGNFTAAYFQAFVFPPAATPEHLLQQTFPLSHSSHCLPLAVCVFECVFKCVPPTISSLTCYP